MLGTMPGMAIVYVIAVVCVVIAGLFWFTRRKS